MRRRGGLSARAIGILEEARDLAGRSLALHPEDLSDWPCIRALERRGLMQRAGHGYRENGCGDGNEVPLVEITEKGIDLLDDLEADS